MDVCRQCGHPHGTGRFCTSCGHPVSEEPAAAPTAGWVPWVAGLTVMLLLAGLGLWLLLGDESAPTATEPASEPATKEQPSRDTRTPQGRATVSPAPRVEPQDLTRTAGVQAPRPAPPTRDVSGDPVRFVAGHLLDGRPQTCWRMPGDGTGQSITFTFDTPVELREVGLVNGYAKSARDSRGTLDWYAGNRRTLRVEWTFDDGTLVTQELEESRRMQSVTVDDVVAEQVTMRLIEVSPPGPGRASRNYTAISGVRLFGTPT